MSSKAREYSGTCLFTKDIENLLQSDAFCGFFSCLWILKGGIELKIGAL